MPKQPLPVNSPAGWAGQISDFLLESDAFIIERLAALCQRLNFGVSASQMEAWRDCIRVLKMQLPILVSLRRESGEWGIVFEYELPRERGRRPDVLILTSDAIAVLEFKQRSICMLADCDQAAAYARDLHEYHERSHEKECVPVVVITGAQQEAEYRGNAWVVGSSKLADMLNSLFPKERAKAPDLNAWIEAEYAPLPSLVAAARTIFNHDPLPAIRRASSAGIPWTLHSLSQTATVARERRERHISLVTGVPGAGKTLVGLQFVYNTRFSDLERDRPAVLLSGNGPLVKVLTHALRSRVFVQDVHAFLVTYGGESTRVPEEHIWVYDEAQRAWDADRAREKRGHDLSEHEDFLRLGARVPDWAMLVGLIGDGQEIHTGEEGGLDLWRQAVKRSGSEWTIHCPKRVAHYFDGCHVEIDDALDLTATLRSHLAADLHKWVAQLLSADITGAAKTSGRIRKAGFDLYITRVLEVAKAYVRERYGDALEKRYGLLGSSKAQVLASYDMDTGFQTTKRLKEGAWYNDDPASPFSCCQLKTVATEFACQGLELDFPIIGWGTDLYWNGDGWERRASIRTGKDPKRLRINSYRVLLTRGRDGMAIFVPPVAQLDETYSALVAGGCRVMPGPTELSGHFNAVSL